MSDERGLLPGDRTSPEGETCFGRRGAASLPCRITVLASFRTRKQFPTTWFRAKLTDDFGDWRHSPTLRFCPRLADRVQHLSGDCLFCWTLRFSHSQTTIRS